MITFQILRDLLLDVWDFVFFLHALTNNLELETRLEDCSRYNKAMFHTHNRVLQAAKQCG